MGLRADLVDGGYLGKIRGVHDFGAGAILEIIDQESGTVMVPFTRAAVPKVDKIGGKIIVDPPIGLIDPIDKDIEDSVKR